MASISNTGRSRPSAPYFRNHARKDLSCRCVHPENLHPSSQSRLCWAIFRTKPIISVHSQCPTQILPRINKTLRLLLSSKLWHESGLGTVQFGFDYVLPTAPGRTPAGEVRAILPALQPGIDTLDTAALYGAAESVLARHRVPTLSHCHQDAGAGVLPTYCRGRSCDRHRCPLRPRTTGRRAPEASLSIERTTSWDLLATACFGPDALRLAGHRRPRRRFLVYSPKKP